MTRAGTTFTLAEAAASEPVDLTWWRRGPHGNSNPSTAPYWISHDCPPGRPSSEEGSRTLNHRSLSPVALPLAHLTLPVGRVGLEPTTQRVLSAFALPFGVLLPVRETFDSHRCIAVKKWAPVSTALRRREQCLTTPSARSGTGIRTRDLWIMSPTRYYCAIPLRVLSCLTRWGSPLGSGTPTLRRTTLPTPRASHCAEERGR